MPRILTCPARIAVRLAIVAMCSTSVLVVSSFTAEAVTVPATLYHERPVGTGVVEPGFPIDHVGVVFDLPTGADADHEHGEDGLHAGTADLRVRFRHDGRWGPWQQVGEDGAQATGQWTGALVSGNDAEAYQLRGVPGFARNARAAALNTTDGPERVVGHRRAGAAVAATTCRSRADWGADESLRTATRSHAPLQVLTVHHTASQNADPDPDARVRAIYAYHTTTNGWDDIGYQALISEAGTVYEGRWSGSDSPSCLAGGGTSRAFGHDGAADDAQVVTGAHAAGHNTGNFGVALLGTLTNTAPTAAARAALVEYLAELAGRHGLDAQGTVDYRNSVNQVTVATISGHRDFGATECPGGVLYADLPAIRADVATALTADPAPAPSPSPAADVDDVTVGELPLLGTVTGTHLATIAADGNVQTITEVESGGKPSQRTSQLEHVWVVDVTGGEAVTLVVDASTTASADGDTFRFDYSVDGGTTYAPALELPAGVSGTQQAALDPATIGTVRIRVTDTDRGRGNRTLDSVLVDQLFVRSGAATSGGVSDPAPEEPTEPAPTGDLGLTTNGTKVKGEHAIVLSWTGADHVRVLRDGSVITDVRGATFTDLTGTKGTAVYRHQVCALGPDGLLTDVCSQVVTTTVG